MIQFKEDSYAFTILKCIAFSGEMPWSSLDLLPGERRILLRYLKKLKDQEYVSIHGKAAEKTIRLTIKGVNKLKEKNEDIYTDYMYNSENHHFRGGSTGRLTKRRNFRINEVCCLLDLINTKIFSYSKPGLYLNNSGFEKISNFDTPYFYYSREIKNVDADQKYKTEFTRILGLLISNGGVYNIYNTNKSLIKWNNQGENKAQVLTEDIVNANFELPFINKNEHFVSDSAIIFGKQMETVLDIINNNNNHSDANGFEFLSFKNSYKKIHYVPINFNGAAMLQILTTFDYDNKIINNLFKEKNEKTTTTNIICDYCLNNTYYLLFFDGDLIKLKSFYLTANLYKNLDYKIMCFPFQYDIIKTYVDELIPIETIPLSNILNILNL